MSDDFRVGDVAQCVIPDGLIIPFGTVCRVLEAYWGQNEDGTLGQGLVLAGWDPGPGYDGFEARSFRKIDAPKTELSQLIKNARPLSKEKERA